MADAVEEIAGQDDDGCKIFVSRIPTAFDEGPVKRLIEDQLGEGSVVEVALVYPHKDDDDDEEGQEQKKHDEFSHEKNKKANQKQEHRGFAFVTMDSVENQQEALVLGTVRGGLKATSTKKHTLYLRPVVRNDGEEERKEICFLWTASRCPYGCECKFAHEGEGACLRPKSGEATTPKKKKCFAFAKGKCKLGDECPFSHDLTTTTKRTAKPDNEKDCINWKSKGKCRKGDECPYRHDPQLQERALKKKRQHSDTQKERQPLSVRVFGLNYDTTAEDVKSYFEHCGPIVELTFPTFEDSGRSKGYCGILFQSPKAVSKAIDLDGKELHGRWLQVQAGKMYLKQWEEQAESRKPSQDHDAVGEFGQKIKKRKHRGH
jgi:RNA recognition motif-containing protein